MKTTSLIRLTVLLSAALLVPPSLFADEKDTLNSTDSQFIKDASASGQSEMKLAELGIQKAQSPKVKSLSETLRNDHRAASTELAKVAKTKGIDVSGSISPEAARAYQTLEQSSGDDFDKAFLKQLASDHKKCIDSFESEAKNVSDGMLKEFVEKTLPVLKSHLSQVEELEKSR